MTITELEKKLKNGTITPGEKVLLQAKKRIEEGKKRGVIVFYENSNLKNPIKMDF
jgi:hypothetical protein